MKIKVSGDYALFPRPEIKAEWISYDVIPPFAAKNILEAIYWHPGMKWKIDRIYVMKPIYLKRIKIHSISSVHSLADDIMARYGGYSHSPVKDWNRKDITDRSDKGDKSSLVLKDVEYVIEAHFNMTDKAAKNDNPNKFINIINRRLNREEYYNTPFLGRKEFPAKVEPFSGNNIEPYYKNENRDLGFMIYDLDYSNKYNPKPLFFRAFLNQGILDLRNCRLYR